MFTSILTNFSSLFNYCFFELRHANTSSQSPVTRVKNPGWNTGEAVHGRGLIDAMTWFGCKGPLRRKLLPMTHGFQMQMNCIHFYLRTLNQILPKSTF